MPNDHGRPYCFACGNDWKTSSSACPKCTDELRWFVDRIRDLAFDLEPIPARRPARGSKLTSEAKT